jgi:hypothetical protein
MSRFDTDYGRPLSPTVSPQVRSTASIVAIIAAIASFFMSGRGHAVGGFFLALLAIGAGLVGGVRALSPRVSGGILSILAVIMGAIAIVFSLVALVF